MFPHLHKVLCCLFLLSFTVLSVTPCVGSPSLVEGNSAFAFNLYKKLSNQQGNLVFSPYSISSALALTSVGARGTTALEMASVLHLPQEPYTLIRDFLVLDSIFNENDLQDTSRLETANSLWPQAGYPFLTEYLELVKNLRGVVKPVDYQSDPESGRKQINDWSNEKTEGRIPELIQPGILDQLTRMVLVNTISFKGVWQSGFKKDDTEKGPFFLDSGKQSLTSLMSQKGKFNYAELERLQIVELPYGHGELSMFLLLPSPQNGLSELEQTLNRKMFEQWILGLKQEDVRIVLPRFKFSSMLALTNSLTALGMGTPFDRKRADFSGMDGQRNWLYISSLLHNAFLEVNETGTEAAAATAVVIRSWAMPAVQPVFRADHPFLFLIRDNRSGTILFMGRVASP